MLTETEEKILAAIQGDLPVVERPFEILAAELGLSESEFLEILDSLCKRGVVRRFGATLHHQKSGYEANAMGAWQVEEDRIEEVGKKMASFPQVTHCYRRDPAGDWPYNLYTMIHARDEDSCRETARKMSQKTGVKNFTLLFSRKELKKTSMAYFPSDKP